MRELTCTPSVKFVQTAHGIGNLQWMPDKSLEADFHWSGPTIDINSSDVDQTIVGFGGAFTESSAVTFRNLSSALQEQLLEQYFGVSGLGYSVGRVHINSCDFSVKSYSFDDVNNDFDLVHFDNLVKHDAAALIPLIKRAKLKVEQAGQALRLLATPWSPPAWMKGNGQMDSSSKTCLREECRGSWAQYIAKWIAAYKAQQIPIWALTVQNEPTNNAAWEACVLSTGEEADFLGQFLGPAMQQQHPEVAIFVFDDSKHRMVDYARAAYHHPTAAQYVHGVAFHWYTGDWFENVATVHREFPQAMLLASEATYERSQWRKGVVETYSDWRFGEGYAHDIIGDLNAGAVGWIDWNLLLDSKGGPNHVGNVCDAAIVADAKTGALNVHPQYYFIGHFSKFLLPGSKRLRTTVRSSAKYTGALRPYGTCTGQDGLEATSFVRPDQQIVTVVLNCADNSVNFKLRHGASAVRASIPAHAVQTYIFQGCQAA